MIVVGYEIVDIYSVRRLLSIQFEHILQFFMKRTNLEHVSSSSSLNDQSSTPGDDVMMMMFLLPRMHSYQVISKIASN